MEEERLLAIANKSERVLNLLATSIQVGVEAVLGTQIGFADARDLARVHALRSSIDLIRAKKEVHREVANPEQRERVVIAEAKVESASDLHLDTVVEIRRATGEVFEIAADARADEQQRQALVVNLRQEILTWGSSYRRFLRQLFELYELRRRQLIELRLEGDEARLALAELEGVFIVALEWSKPLSV